MSYAFGRKRKIEPAKKQKWLAPQLDRRIKIFAPTQTENASGGFDQTYTVLKEIWARVRPISHNSYMRYSNTEVQGNISHEAWIRKSAVDDLHTQFSSAFGSGVDIVADLNPIKSNMYLMLITSSTTGKFFRIRRIMNVEENDEYLSILCEETEEIGTGIPNLDENGIL